MFRPTITAALAALALAGAGLAVPTVTAAPADPPTPKTLAKGLMTPLSVAVARDGTVFYSQNFAGQIHKLGPGKKPKRVYAVKTPGDEAGALSWRAGELTFAITPGGPPEERRGLTKLGLGHQKAAAARAGSARVMVVKKSGAVRKLADLGAHEAKHNPDGGVTYGFVGISDECAAQLPPDVGPATYQGEDYSHPYATTSTREKTYVADAGANDVVSISRSGKVRTVAVLKPAEVPVTAELAAGFGLPECAVGLTYLSEPVPTDIEVHRGRLHVTTLGGGLGEALPLGAVHRINPKTGRVTTPVSGLSAPVGLGLNPRGTMFVSQLFAGSIVKVPAGSTNARPYATIAMPAAIEWDKRGLYATVRVLSEPPAGKLVRFHR